MSQAILRSHGLAVRRGGHEVLDIPALSVETGEFLSLIGPNGTGKSTLLLALSCLLKPFRGQLFFHDREIRDSKAVINYRRHTAMVFQEPLLFDTTVFDNVASGLKIRGLSKKERKPIVAECLERFGITHLADRSARKLSGGEAQRTSLARAFATRPEIIFLDEPFSALDPPTRTELINDLDRNLKEMRTTALMATHDQLEALRLSDRVAVMNHGKIVQIGSAAQVMNHPVDEFVAAFTGMETLLEGAIRESQQGVIIVDVGSKAVEAVGDFPVETKVICCIRPEHVTLAKAIEPVRSSARNILQCKIESIELRGLFYRIVLDCGFSLVAYVTRPSMEELCLKSRDEVIASFKATAVHIIRSDH
ncbi:MAG: ABC transporter ATP-binding protein [Syntrophaceae bacterium]|nr:ABC transporter ATP-binding protein [Syntrophaceae bacterium]